MSAGAAARTEGVCHERFEAVRAALDEHLRPGEELATSRLAEQAPWWPPGTASGYQARSQGYLVGEVIRRVTGATVRELVAAEVAAPLAVDFQIGAREGDWSRTADVVPPPPEADAQERGHPALRGKLGPSPDPRLVNTASWRRAEIPSSNGHGNARPLARILSAIARGGEVDGTRLLGPATIGLIFEEQASGTDLVLGVPLRWGIGFALPHREAVPYLPNGRICFWGGWGGSLTVTDLERKLTISYVMNRMAPGVIGSERSARYVDAIYRAV